MRRVFNKLSFRKKLIMSYTLIGLFLLSVMSGVILNISQSSLYKQAYWEAESFIGQLTGEVEQKLEQYMRNTNLVAYDRNVHSVMLSRAASDYKLLTMVNGYFEPLMTNITKLDATVKKVQVYTQCGKYPSSYILNVDLIRQTDWYDKLGDKRGAKCFFGSDETFVAQNIFETNSRGLKLGVIRIDLDLGKLMENALTNERYSPMICLISDSGEIAATPNSPVTSKWLDGVPNANETVNIDGKDCFRLSNDIVGTGWKLICFIEAGRLVINTSETFRFVLLLNMLCLSITGCLTAFFSRSFTKRITYLNSQMEAVENGNMNIHVSSAVHDEIGLLTERFESMLCKIRTLIDEVYQVEIDRKSAQLQALSKQMNPHFFYNVLSLINWKMIMNNQMEISRIIQNVANYYRASLGNGNEIITVREEVANVCAYAEICQEMNEGSFTWESDVDQVLLDEVTPRFILQPLFENALVHGVNKRDGDGRIVISVKANDGRMSFSVWDDGPGMSPERIGEVISGKAGYALKNLMQRINLYNGDAAISIKCAPGTGTSVTVSFPPNRTSYELNR